MTPGARKVGDGWYAVIRQEKRIVWTCDHKPHATRKEANRCARRELRSRAKQSQSALPARQFRPRAPLLVLPGKDSLLAATKSGTPLVFRRSYVEGFLQCTEVERASGDNAEYGIAVHDAIHQYLRQCLSAREESRISDIPQIMIEVFARHGGVHPDRFGEAADMVEQYARSHLADIDTLLHVEGQPALEFQLTADLGWATFTGTCDRIDRMDGDDPYDPPRLILIRDYKTQWAKVEHTFQGRFYAALAFRDKRINSALEGVAVEFDHLPLRNGMVWHPGRVENQLAYFEPGDLDQWFNDNIDIFRRRYEGPRGHPVGGLSCQYCAKRYRCAAATLVSATMPEDKEQARELVGDWIRTEERAKLLKEALEKHYQHRKPDVFDGMEVGFLRPKKSTWRASDPQGIAGYLDKRGMDGRSVLDTIVNKKLIPDYMYPELVTAGVARWDEGEATFKRRLADGKDE